MTDVITIPVIVEYLEEDEVYCVSTPLLPGCRAWGETLDEAMRAMPGNIRAMISAWKEKGIPLTFHFSRFRRPYAHRLSLPR